MSAGNEASGAAMRAEIAEQPAVWRRWNGRHDEIRELADRLRGTAPRSVTFLARGTSRHAALYGKYLVETLWGLPSGQFAPSTVTVYGARQDLRTTLVVAISQSGASPDLIEALRAAREMGATTLALVNRVDSELAAAADHVLDVGAGPELAVAATKSYTAELLALALIVTELARTPAIDVPGLADHGERLLAGLDVAPVLPLLLPAERLALVGRGYSLSTALEGALKLMETNYVWAQGFSSAEFLHGPVAAVGPDVPVIGVGAAEDHPAGLVERVRANGAPLIVVGGQAGGPWGGPTDGPADGPADAVLPIPLVSPMLRPLLDILPLQTLALELAIHRGYDPDRPRGLVKETLTR